MYLAENYLMEGRNEMSPSDTSFLPLISPIKGKDFKLWQALNLLYSMVSNVNNSVNDIKPQAYFDSIRFVVFGAVVTQNQMVPIYRVMIPRDQNNNLLFTSFQISVIYATLISAPITSLLSCDILISRNGGSYNTILSSTKISFAVGQSFSKYSDTISQNSFQDGDLLRLDVLSADGNAANLEVVMGGQYVN